MPTLDVRDTLQKTLSESLVQDVKILNEQWIKDMLKMKSDIEQYAVSLQPQAPQPLAWQWWDITQQDIQAAQSQISNRWINATPEQLAELGM